MLYLNHTVSVVERGEEMEWLKKFRNEQGLTLNEMAEKLGISKSMYEKVEYGDRGASVQFIKRFKQVFPHIDINIFFTERLHD